MNYKQQQEQAHSSRQQQRKRRLSPTGRALTRMVMKWPERNYTKKVRKNTKKGRK